MPDEPHQTTADFDQAALTAPIAAPVADMPDHEPQPWLQEARRPKSRKKWLIAMIILVLLGGGGGAVYALWYQSPDKIVLDAIAGAVTARTVVASGSYSATTGGVKYQVTFAGKGGYTEGASGTAQVKYTPASGTTTQLTIAGARSETGDSFVKIDNMTSATPLLLQFLTEKITPTGKDVPPQVSSLYMAYLQPIVSRLDGNWVKFTGDDLTKIDAKTGEDYNCIEKTVNNLHEDNAKLIELGSLYWQNSFIVIKQSLGTHGGNVGYLVGVDTAKLTKFVESLKSSKFYTDLRACSLSFDLDKLTIGKDARQAELWIDSWSHQLRSVAVEGKDDAKFTIKTAFNQPVVVDKPSSALSLSDIFGELSILFVGLKV